MEMMLAYPVVVNRNGFIQSIWKYDTGVLKAISPMYIYRYFRRGGRDSWLCLGGIMLSITGTEALFGDLSHFHVPSIQIASTTVVFAYLMKNTCHVVDAFYSSIPDCIYWPVVLVATAASDVASQATICATFSLIKQALALGCFPRVKIVRTSKRFVSHIYIPDINWILMILCVGVTAGFKNRSQIGNASGTTVITNLSAIHSIAVLICVKWIHPILPLIRLVPAVRNEKEKGVRAHNPSANLTKELNAGIASS